MLELRGLGRRFNGVAAVDAVSLTIPAGQMVGVIGRSGAGKSTLLRMVNRLTEPSEGRVLFGTVTDANSNRNGIIALDVDVMMREGNVIDGVRLTPPGATPNEVRLDDRGRAVTLWTNNIDSTFLIFFTPDTSDFSTTRELVSEGSALDFDGDGTLDATLHRFRFLRQFQLRLHHQPAHRFQAGLP